MRLRICVNHGCFRNGSNKHLGLHQQDFLFLVGFSLSCDVPKATLPIRRIGCRGYLGAVTLRSYCLRGHDLVSVLIKVARLENAHVVAIENVVSDIHVFVSSRGDLDVTILDHMKKGINNAIVENISHFENATNSIGPETERQEIRQHEASEVRFVV